MDFVHPATLESAWTGTLLTQDTNTAGRLRDRLPALAEREGFEPPEPFSSTVFKTAVIDHSTTSPCHAGETNPRHSNFETAKILHFIHSPNYFGKTVKIYA